MSKQKKTRVFCEFCGKTEIYFQHTINKYYYCGRCKEIRTEKELETINK